MFGVNCSRLHFLYISVVRFTTAAHCGPYILYVFKVFPRSFIPEDANAKCKTKKACLLNRKLTATLKRWPCVRILNAEISLRRHENAVPS